MSLRFRMCFCKKMQDWLLNSENSKTDFAFLYQTGQFKISQIMVRQRNRRIRSGNGFLGSFDAPSSERSWIDLFSNETKNPFPDSFRILVFC